MMQQPPPQDSDKAPSKPQASEGGEGEYRREDAAAEGDEGREGHAAATKVQAIYRGSNARQTRPLKAPEGDPFESAAVANDASSLAALSSPASSAKVVVRLLRGDGLPAADKNGLSDPYVKLKINKETKTSAVLKKTLNPEWNADFEFAHAPFDLSGKRLVLEVFDKDFGVFDKDDRLGLAEVDLSTVQRGGAPVPFAAQLSTSGTLYLSVEALPASVESGCKSKAVSSSTPTTRPSKMPFTTPSASLPMPALLPTSDKTPRKQPRKFVSSEPPAKKRLKEVGRARAKSVAKAKGGVIGGVQRRAYSFLQKKVSSKLHDMYCTKIKPSLAADRRMPWALRVAIHEVVDEVWEGVQLEVERVFEKLMENSKDVKEDDPKQSLPPSPPPERVVGAVERRRAAPSPPPSPPPEMDDAAEALERPSSSSTRPENAVRFTVTLLRATGLLAADKNGFSDPYAKLKLGKELKKSTVVKKNLNPTWNNETFSWVVKREAAWGSVVEIEMKDEDKGLLAKDDTLGVAKLTLEQFKNAQEGGEAALNLDTQGQVIVRVRWAPETLEEQEKKGFFLHRSFNESSKYLRSKVAETLVEKPFEGEALQVSVTLLRGTGLKAADKNGLSDPYVTLKLGKEKFKSEVVNKTINPVWEAAEFVFLGDPDVLKASPLALEVYDRDEAVFDRDDKLGHAQIDITKFKVGAPPAEVEVDLNTMGTLVLKVQVDTKLVGALALKSKLGNKEDWRPYMGWTEQALKKKRTPWEILTRDFSEAALKVRIVGADGLRAADRGGKSDPYVRIMFGPAHKAKQQKNPYAAKSLVQRKTVQPIWDEEFTFAGPLREMLAQPMQVNVYDCDEVSLDDLLGRALINLDPLFAKSEVGKSKKFCLSLLAPKGIVIKRRSNQGKGEIYLELTLTSFSVPNPAQLAYRVVYPFIKPLESVPPWFKEKVGDLSSATLSFTITDIAGLSSPRAGAKPSIFISVSLLGTEQLSSPVLLAKNDPASFYHKFEDFSGTVAALRAQPLQVSLLVQQAKRGSTSFKSAELITKIVQADTGDRSFELPIDVPFMCPFTLKQRKCSVKFNVAVVGLDKPPREEIASYFLSPLLFPITVVRNLPQYARDLQHRGTNATVEVTLHYAQGILASDKGGTSDAYATIALGQGADGFRWSTVFPKSLDPVWEEKFVFTGTIGSMTSLPLTIEFFDEDLFDRDDPLGSAELDLAALLDAGVAPAATPFDIPISASGAPDGVHGLTHISVQVKALEPPTKKEVLLEQVSNFLLGSSNFVKYHRMPYDTAIWSKLRDWRFLTIMLIAANPNVFIRGGFFTFFLISIVKDREEFQLNKFILGMKGTQFISGVIKAIIAYAKFWACTVLDSDAMACRDHGPGVGSSVVFTANLLLYMQLLLYIAFIILPYAKQYEPSTGWLNGTRAEELWIENYLRSAKAATDRHVEAKGAPYQKLLDIEQGEEPSEIPPFELSTFFARVGFRELRIRWSALLYPLLNASSKNRLVALLKWDLAMFTSCAFLLFLGVYLALRAEEKVRAELAGEPVNELAAVWPLINFSMFSLWQCQITFSVIKVFFSLSSAPFFIFTIGGLNKLFTHCEATAYSADGSIRPMDTNGLSNYLRWIEEDLIYNSAYEDEIRMLDQAAKGKLTHAVESGHQCLAKAWTRPSTALRVTRKKKVDIDEVLKKIVTRESASEDLYKRCFPDLVIVERYLEAKAKEKLESEEEAKQKPF